MRHNPERSLGKILDNEETSRVISAGVTNIAYQAKVVDIDDPKFLKRIKVRILGVDDGIEDKDLPWCVSSMPSFFFWLPRVDENVLVVLMSPWNKRFTRVWTGPIDPAAFVEE